MTSIGDGLFVIGLGICFAGYFLGCGLKAIGDGLTSLGEWRPKDE